MTSRTRSRLERRAAPKRGPNSPKAERELAPHAGLDPDDNLAGGPQWLCATPQQALVRLHRHDARAGSGLAVAIVRSPRRPRPAGRHRTSSTWPPGSPSTARRACGVSTASIAGSCSGRRRLRDETGKIVGWYGTITDIEDRKRAEQKAVEAERELQMAIDNIPVLVGTFAADGTRLFVNKRTFEVTGLSAEDVPGDGWTRKAFHPEDVEASRAPMARMPRERRAVRARNPHAHGGRHISRALDASRAGA